MGSLTSAATATWPGMRRPRVLDDPEPCRYAVLSAAEFIPLVIDAFQYVHLFLAPAVRRTITLLRDAGRAGVLHPQFSIFG